MTNSATLLKYGIYPIGYFCIFYIFLIIFRHLLLYYIIKSLQKIFNLSQKQENTEQKNEDATDREDELKRDQEQEIFKFQANEIKKKINNKQESDVIEVGVERVSQTSRGANDVFAGSRSRLGITQEQIVGYAKPIGKFTSILLGQKLSQIASIMQTQGGVTKEGYWTAYINARKQASIEHNQSLRQ